jgi:hypothetical protein
MTPAKGACPLCGAIKELLFVQGPDKRKYIFCATCFLIYVDKQDLLNKEDERKRYLTHNNSVDQEGYVQFLSQAIDPALKFLAKDMVGVDYGGGPGPTLSTLLLRKGYECEDYDPFFMEHDLEKKFDFIFCTEAFEHFVSLIEILKRTK